MKKLLLLSCVTAFAVGETLPQLIELSYENRLVQSSKMGVEAIQKEYSSVQSGYLPSVSVGGSYRFADKESASAPDKGASAYAKVQYTLYDGGKKYDIYDRYEASITASKRSLLSLKNQIALDVTTLYYDYQTAMAAKTAKEKEIEQLQAQHKRLQNFYQSGTVTEDEVQRIISQLQSQKVALHEIELTLETIIHNLSYITGQSVSVHGGSSIIFEDVSQAKRFDLQAMEYEVKAMRYDADAQKSDYLPTLYLDNTYTVYDYDYEGAAYPDPVDQNIFSVNLSWDIFNFNQTKNAHAAKLKSYMGQKYKLDYEKEKADTDLQLAKRAHAIAKQQIIAAKEALKAANATYKIVRSKFENGLVDNVAFLDALSQKYDAQSAYEKARNELEKKKVTILYHGGKNIKDFVQ